MTLINILRVVLWKSRQAFRAYGRGNMPLQAVKLPISPKNVLNIFVTFFDDTLGVVVSSPKYFGDWCSHTRGSEFIFNLQLPVCNQNKSQIYLRQRFKQVYLTRTIIKIVLPVVAKEAHTDGTRVVQCQSDNHNSMKTTIMQMPMDFLEIPEPSLPQGFLKLDEEARNVNVESGQSCYTEEVQSQGAGLTRPVFVNITEDSSSVVEEGVMTAPGVSTERIPPVFSAGHCYPVDQLGLVGPWDKTEQSILPGSDTKEVGTDPAGPVGPHVTVDPIQPVAEGPVGQYITRHPVGPDGMLSTCDSDQPMADGPLVRFTTLGPVGSDRMLSTCDSDQPVASRLYSAQWALE